MEHETFVHLVVGPRQYIGLQAQGRIVCGHHRVDMYHRTRDVGKATCPLCTVEEIALAADQAAWMQYVHRMRATRSAIADVRQVVEHGVCVDCARPLDLAGDTTVGCSHCGTWFSAERRWSLS